MRTPYRAAGWLLCLLGLLWLLPAQSADNPAAPPFVAGLTEALQHYRRLAADAEAAATWQTPLPPVGRKIEPGAAYAGLPLLARRLALLGDLPPASVLPQTYSGVLIEAVITFQRRHGIEPDGVIGRQTLAELEISPAQRVRQIEVNIERARQLPLPNPDTLLLVNVPEFVLRGYRAGTEALRMKIVVGRALRTRTPLFSAQMSAIEFSPYWNVPPSIARAEMLPKLEREPELFAQQGFEFYDGQAVIDALTAENIAAAQAGRLRLRQRPGPQNALGGIKFVFPNQDNIYLHDTPARRLFARARRDFSHGCIRLEAPLELARFVLREDPDWSAERIGRMMASGNNAWLRLPAPVPVVIAYLTALPAEDGSVHFFPDIYHLDGIE